MMQAYLAGPIQRWRALDQNQGQCCDVTNSFGPFSGVLARNLAILLVLWC
jgi:hypothetical protein